MDEQMDIIRMEPYDFFGFDGPTVDSPLTHTTYFRTERAKKGYAWLIRKCDNYHLIIPPSQEHTIKDMLTAKFIHVVFGSVRTTILFDDLSLAPLFLQIDNQQIFGIFKDVVDKPMRKGFLAIYIFGEKGKDDTDTVKEVGRMDLWISRSFEQTPYEYRRLTTDELSHYRPQE